jgi:hypothetical protein
VVVASKNGQSITQSDGLAVVPYDSGEITIRRQAGKSAEIVGHYFGGATTREQVPITDGRLTLNAQLHDRGGKPLEWIEVGIG